MEHGNEKQLIYFKDLLFSVLYQWKKILVLAVALAVVLGAVGVLTKDEPVSVGGLSVTPQVQAKVDYLESRLDQLERNIQLHNEYMTNSILMTMDPYNVSASGFFVYAQPHYEGPNAEAATVEADTAALLQAYRATIIDSETINKLAEQVDMDRQYLHELLTFDTTISGYLVVSVKTEDMALSQTIADGLLKAAKENIGHINSTVHSHKVTFVPTQSGPVYDVLVADKQAAAQKTLANFEAEQLTVETELKKYAPSQLTVSESTSPLLYAIVGGFLGAFLVVAYALIAHLGSEKIYSDRVLTNRTGIRVLGCVQSTQKRNVIDLWLRKLEGRATHNSFDSVAINIRNRCKDAKTLLIMGNFQADALADVTATLEKAGIHCLLCTDPAVKADALEALPTCDAVVLAEVCGSSRYDSVEWAMQTIADHEKPLLGCVLIDG